MKVPEGVAAQNAKGDAPPKPATGEWDGRVGAMGDEFVELEDQTERAVLGGEDSFAQAEPVASRGEAYVPHERRATVVSPISAELAKSMDKVRDPAAPQEIVPRSVREVRRVPTLREGRRAGPEPEPAAPAVSSYEVTRRVEESGPAVQPKDEMVETYSIELIEELALPPKEQVESLIERARSAMEGGNLGAAVIAADQALAEAGHASDEEVGNLVKLARPLFDRIFAAYVGLLEQIPERARSDEQIAGQEIGDRTKQLLAGVDGLLTLEQLSTRTGIPPVEAMAIAASLLAAAIIRIK